MKYEKDLSCVYNFNQARVKMIKVHVGFILIVMAFNSICLGAEKETRESFEKKLTPGQKRSLAKAIKELEDPYQHSSNYGGYCKAEFKVKHELDPMIMFNPKWQDIRAYGWCFNGSLAISSFCSKAKGTPDYEDIRKRVVAAVGKLKKIRCLYDWDDPNGKVVKFELKDNVFTMKFPGGVKADSYTGGIEARKFMEENFEF
jgi:hypothetical protein